MNMNINQGNSQENGVSSYIMNKIIGAYKTTKESPYVKSLYQPDDHNSNPDTSNGHKLPTYSSITIYPSYGRYENGEYFTRVKGIVTSSPPVLSRKNRFLLSMARRIIKTNDSIDSSQFEDDIRNAITNQETVEDDVDADNDNNSTASSNSSINLNVNVNDTIKSRMEGIFAKCVSNTPLNITIGSDEPVDQLVGANLTTDSFGLFQISIVTPYKPSYIAISSILNPSVLQTCPIQIIDSHGVSIITDIDDTIRLTGVLGDKRELFRNIFSKPYESCEVKGVSPWFNELSKSYNCPIHYVSNSPWQVYNICYGFMKYLQFPITSIHLRQYSGNLVTSFTQPSAERKKPSLISLFREFPTRKFILIGDTGEQDLEAYLSLIPEFKSQILAIYLRIVPKSFSSLDNDVCALNEIKKIINKNKSTGLSEFLKNPTGIDSDDSDSYLESDNRMVRPTARNNLRNDLTNTPIGQSSIMSRRRSSLEIAKSTAKKLAPIVPMKPESLRGRKIPKDSTLHNGVIEGDNSSPPPPPLPERKGSNNTDFVDFTDSFVVDDTNVDVVDKRFNVWKQRAYRIADEIPDDIEFQFWDDLKKVHDDSIKLLNRELK